MIKFRESRTAKNLLVSFAAESQANMRYLFFAEKAEKDGYIQIANIFKETADQEKEHALRFFKFFNKGDLEFTERFPTGIIAATYDNLIGAAELEKRVHSEMYPGFAKIARQESFERAAENWDAISIAEKQHEENFLSLAENIKKGIVTKRDEKMTWVCNKCGYIHKDNSPPEKCPACMNPAGYFEIFCKNW